MANGGYGNEARINADTVSLSIDAAFVFASFTFVRSNRHSVSLAALSR